MNEKRASVVVGEGKEVKRGESSEKEGIIRNRVRV
jgi:hypothetical protein